MTSAIPPRPSRASSHGMRKPITPHPIPKAPEIQYVYVERPRRKFNGATVVGLVLSLLWLFGIGSLLGLIIGISSVRQCQRDDESGEWAGHLAWIFGLVGVLSTLALIAGGV